MSRSSRDFGREQNWFMAKRVFDRRKQLGLTQPKLAVALDAAGMMLSTQRISQIEKGAGLDATQVEVFAVALQCTTTYLLGGTDNPKTWKPDKPLGEWITRVFIKSNPTLSVVG